MYTIYAFGNGYLLYGMFQAIALFFKNNNIGVLLTILAMIAVIYYAARVTIYHQHSLVSTAKYFIAFSIILTALVYNQTTVIINDVSNPAAPTNAQPISNVPWGIAVLWSDFTTLQYGLAKDFTDDFSVPAGDNMLSEGLGVSIIQQADSATISTSNSYLYEDYNNYISNCVAPGITSGNLNISELLGAGDATDTASQTYNPNAANSIWTVMSNFTEGSGANILDNWYSGSSNTSTTYEASGISAPGGTTTTCGQVTKWLYSAVYNFYIPEAGSAIAGELQMASFSDLSNSIGVMNPYLFNMQQGGQAQLMQAIGVNMYAPAILKMAQASGSNASSLAVATGTGEISTQTGMMESGILAGKYMPIVFGIFEAILLGASVIIFILIITHMGISYLKLLFQLMIMITIWPSLTAIFNYITQLIIQAQYQPIAGLGYSVSGSGTVNSFLATSLTWMGYFSWSVPMVAYMIASGSSYAVASVVGGMDSAISKNASVKGADAGMGNMTAGQDRVNNYLANATNVTNVQHTGYRARNFINEHGANTEESIGQNAGTTHKTSVMGGNNVSTDTSGTGISTTSINGKIDNTEGPINANIAEEFKALNQRKLEHAEARVSTLTHKISSAKESTTKLSNELSALRSEGTTAGNGGTVTRQGQVVHDSKGAHSHKVATSKGYTSTYHQGTGVEVNGGVTAGDKGSGASVGAGTKANVGHSQDWIKSKTTTNANTVASSNNNDAAISANLIRKYGSVKNAENAISAKLSTSESRLHKLENMRSEEEKNEQRYSHSISAVSTQSGGVSDNAMPYILRQWGKEHGLSGKNATEAEHTEYLNLVKDNRNNPVALRTALSSIVNGESGFNPMKKAINTSSAPLKTSIQKHGINPNTFKGDYVNSNNKLNSSYNNESNYFTSLYNQNSKDYWSIEPSGGNSFTGTENFTHKIYNLSSDTPKHGMPSLSYHGAEKRFKEIENHKPIATSTINDFNKQQVQERLKKDGVRSDGLFSGGEWLISEAWKKIV